MMILDNINRFLGDDLKQTIRAGARLKIAAATFSIYAFEALKAELERSTPWSSSSRRRRLSRAGRPTSSRKSIANSTSPSSSGNAPFTAANSRSA